MTDALAVHLNYHTKSEGRELHNDIMLFALGLDYEAQKYGIQLVCDSKPEERQLDLILFGETSVLQTFLNRLKTKKLEHVTVDDYGVVKSEPYNGRAPDWKYHDLVSAARAAYLRTEYMKDVHGLLEQLERKKSVK